VLKWEKEIPKQGGKVATPIVFQKYTANWAIQIHIRTVPASENYEVATLPSKDLLQIGASTALAYT
jgi:hypothetical protein